MPPRLNLLSAAPRALAFRPKPATPQWRLPLVARRCYSAGDDAAAKKQTDLPVAEEGAKGPNTETLPHVSEEASAMAKIRGGEGPDVTQGTPVEEVVAGDKEAEKNLPEVMKTKNKKPATAKVPSGTRGYATQAEVVRPTMLQQPNPLSLSSDGLKFGPVAFPMPAENRLKSRYDPVVDQVTKLLMQDGKLSVAQRNMSIILNYLRTASPPVIDPRRPLLPGAPPPSHLPLNPVLYLTLAIDSVAPLLRFKSIRGAAGGGVALQIPTPLSLRQRRRTAIMWILGAAEKRKFRGSGKGSFAYKVAEELVAVVQGSSAVWERRNGLHKVAVAARANLNYKGSKGR
ncbi:uncharacterized protein K452DRAFT_235589 [Aplosporella prunicola CBS 121167]|uniref:Small ribosomal subunit protein uS7m n=1 Tax=Aplosporella prunicola CBS 121167 TaxID=1176127 RepID=A0A6A6B1E4_9PEZI|nr:uncharacterized protein K452DRAFT_235589 [Aplosporella prunicola CBS 121167]KAF2137646.1 hypothetical protein K452DRAFT_235589 [Aplosporella prunicola CBS 121167]